MYPWETIDPDVDSTIRLIHEAATRGHNVAIATLRNLTMRDNVASVFCKMIIKENIYYKSTKTFYKGTKFKRVRLPLAGFDAIIMRSEPPLDTIALNFLDSVREDVFIMNDIHGLRIACNKLYIASFDDRNKDFIPSTHVSKVPEYLEDVLRHSNSDKMILKPLDSYGGKGVIIVEKKAMQSFRSLIEFYINSGGGYGNYVILQEYVEGAEFGDVRILLLNGEPIGAMRRIPDKNDIRSNIHAGGTVAKHTLTKEEKELCKHIGAKLVRDGLYFVGIDVINGKLIEVNVLSPGGITRINNLNKVKLQKQIIDFVENIVNKKQAVFNKRNEFRKVIEDANIR